MKHFKVNDDIIFSDHRLITFDCIVDLSSSITSNKMDLKVVDNLKFTFGINKVLISIKKVGSNTLVSVIDGITRGIQLV